MVTICDEDIDFAVEMNGLNDEGFDLSLIGFGEDELAALVTRNSMIGTDRELGRK